jgi:hypothetical protein
VVRPQYDNLALPSIVSMQGNDTYEDVLEGYDFPITPPDARQYAADKMLEALEFVQMTFADIEASNARAITPSARKSSLKRLPKQPRSIVQ